MTTYFDPITLCAAMLLVRCLMWTPFSCGVASKDKYSIPSPRQQ
jgi:hypothetical protein